MDGVVSSERRGRLQRIQKRHGCAGIDTAFGHDGLGIEFTMRSLCPSERMEISIHRLEERGSDFAVVARQQHTFKSDGRKTDLVRLVRLEPGMK